MSEVIVAKAGGTSNADAAAVEQSLGWAGESDIFVVSAPGKLEGSDTVHGKVTGMLLGAHAYYGSTGEISDHYVDAITERFAAIRDGLGETALPASWVDGIPERVRTAVRTGEDAASMLGERLQAEVYESLGFTLLDPARSPHVLSSNPEAWRGWLEGATKPGERYVLPGNTTVAGDRLATFGPGGSDISGGLGAYGIQADLHLNLTDHGAKSTDPKLIGEGRAKPIGHMLYEEGRELGHNGSGLVHPAAMIPLMIAGIPTEIRSTFDRDAEFTLLDNDTETAESRAGRTIAMSLMGNVVMHRLHEPGMAEAVGRLAVFEQELAENGIALIDSQGDGIDGQRYFVEGGEAASEALEVLQRAVGAGGSVEPINDGRPLHFLTLVGYRLHTKLLDYTNHLVGNWGQDIRRWQSEGHDFSPGRHSLRISLPSEAEAHDTLDRLHRSLIETPDRAPVTWRDTGRSS